MSKLGKNLIIHASAAQRFFSERSKGLQKSHACYNLYCLTQAQAIKTHVLQKNGVLNYVSEDNGNGKEIVELRMHDVFKNKQTANTYGFFKTGVTKSNELAFWGFCSECDRKLFSDLETGSRDFTDIRNQTLLSYRALAQDVFKQEYNVELYNKIRNDNSFPLHIRNHYRDAQISQAASLLADYDLKKRLEYSLFNRTIPYPFKFISFYLPKVPIALSSIMGGPHSHAIPGNNIEALLNWRPNFRATGDVSPYRYNGPLGSFNLIPRDNDLLVIIGYDEKMTEICEVPINSILSLDIAEKFKLISDIIITREESWCISPSLHKQFKQLGRDKLILDAITYHFPFKKKFEMPKMNMFEGLGLF